MARKIRKIDVIAPVIAVIAIILFFIYCEKYDGSERDKYILLPDSVKSEVKGFVLRERPLGRVGVSYIDLSNGGKYKLRRASFIRRDYYIHKPTNTDSIYIYDRKNRLVSSGIDRWFE